MNRNSLNQIIVKIPQSGYGMRGTGFIIQKKYIITASHVLVNPKYQNKSVDVIGQKIIPERLVGSPMGEAEVIYWEDSEKRDIAVLKITELPEDVPEVFLSDSEYSTGNNFITYGFPDERKTEGLGAGGTIRMYGLGNRAEGTKILELADTKLGGGFSGAPVFDTDLNRIVGFISKYSGAKYETGICIPSESIFEALSDVIPDIVVSRDDFLISNSDEIQAKLSDYIPASTEIKMIGVELLKYCNEHALNWLDAIVRGNEESVFNERVWDEIFNNEDEIGGQKHFVDTREVITQEFVKQKTCRKLYDSVQNDSPQKIWLVGEAGVGKTTTLFNIFFEILEAQEDYPVPFLIEPQEFNKTDIENLSGLSDSPRILLGGILKVWLRKRDVFLSDSETEKLTESVFSGLKSGEIALLLDSYDELSRMKIQAELFLPLLKSAKRYICASRPETYNQGLENHIKIQIKSPWDITTIEQYLNKKLFDFPDLIRGFLVYLSRNEQVFWLRNPRYINLIVTSVLENDEIKNYSFTELKSLLDGGEYQVFDQVFEFELRRISFYIAGKIDRLTIRDRFTEVAKGQLNFGSYSLARSDFDEYWEALLKMTAITDTVVENASGHQIRLRNQNFVDYFLTKELINEIYSDELKNENEFTHLWSANLLTYLSEELLKDATNEKFELILDRIAAKIDNLRLPENLRNRRFTYEIQPSQHDRLKQFQAVNLFQLVVLLYALKRAREEKSQVNITRKEIIIEPKRIQLNDLFCFNIDLSHIRFKDCDFSGSLFHNANLEYCQFTNCEFHMTNFRNARLNWAKFEDCRFYFDHIDKDKIQQSPFWRTLIQGAEFNECENDQNYELITTDYLVKMGAIGRKSRYASPFGRKFFENMRLLLGNGLSRAERTYTKHIQSYLDLLNKKEAVFVIDLMAGGNNKRLTSLFQKNSNLNILAVDRDTSQMEEVVELPGIGSRLSPMEIEISGEIDLNRAVRNYLKMPSGQVDLIIGKKALHEISRENQRILIKAVSETLKPGGRFILFADSPVQMSEEGFVRLNELKSKIRENQKDYDKLRNLLLNELNFSDTLDDCAVFSNIWVFLKDLANRNMHEFNNRYFSSSAELKKWGNESNLELINNPVEEREHYSLTARLFNEIGINRCGIWLQRRNNVIETQDYPYLRTELLGTKRAEYQIFTEFAEFHLWNYEGKNSEKGKPHIIGEALNAKRVPVLFGEIYHPLRKISGFPFKSGVSFDFSVHVLVFEKKQQNEPV